MAIGGAQAAVKGKLNCLSGEGAPPFSLMRVGRYEAGAGAGFGSGLSCFLDQSM